MQGPNWVRFRLVKLKRRGKKGATHIALWSRATETTPPRERPPEATPIFTWWYCIKGLRLPRRMRLYEVVIRNLRCIRHGKGLSQEELADRASIKPQLVGMLEREEHAETVDMLEELAEILETRAAEFVRQRR